MSRINIMALGGLNENGKNLYTISVNDKILIFDCGLKYAPDKMYGVDYIIPDFSYLEQIKYKILGVFISHPHNENMGALTDLIKIIPDIKVYCTDYTYKIIQMDLIEENIEFNNFEIIKPHVSLKFDEFTIFPFSVTHSSPDTVGFSVNTKDGCIIYMADFIIDPTMTKHYDMDLGKLAYIGKKGVLALMCESVFAEKKGHTSPKHKLEPFFKSLVERNKGRIIFTLLPLHIYTIQEIFNSIKGKNRKVVIMGKELISIINMCVKDGYLEIEDNIIGDLTNLKDLNSIVLVSNDRQNPYHNISRIVNGYDKFITLNKTDTICFAEPSYDAYESIIVKLMNDISIKGANIEVVPKEKSVRHHASSEDIMLLIKLFNPKYYLPIKGEYRYQVENSLLAQKVGVKNDNIIIAFNGEVISFEDGKLIKNRDTIKVDDVLIDGKSTQDIGDLVLKDREMLGENGLLLISVTLDKKTKKVLIGPEILSKGFIYSKDNLELINNIKEKSLEIIKSNIHGSKYADYTQIRNQIREVLGSYLYEETDCKPVILTVIQEA